MNFIKKYFLIIGICILAADDLSGQMFSQSIQNSSEQQDPRQFRTTTPNVEYPNPCDSNPCQDYGICNNSVEFFPFYSCTCKTGFSRLNLTYCNDTDECISRSPICGNNVCFNERGWFRCICGPNFAGSNCSIARDPLKPAPEFHRISHTEVIEAGGTRVTVWGANLNVYPILRIILRSLNTYNDPLFAIVVQDLENSTFFDFIVPQAPNENFLNAKFSVNVLYFADNPNIVPGDYLNTYLNITYVKNPVLDDIFPKTLLADGGVTIYGAGTGFEIISEILLIVDVNIMDLYERPLYTDQYTEECSVDKSQGAILLKCIWPNLNISTQILPELNILYPDVPSRKRRQVSWTRERPVSSQTVDNRIVETYMGITFDGFKKYVKLGNAKPNIALKLTFKNPVFAANLKDLMVIKKLEDLKIRGEDVDVGVTLSDYKVLLSADNCRVTGISSNLINCLPPKIKPPTTIQAVNDVCYKWPASFPVNILLGRNTAKYFIGCADYEHEFWTLRNVILIAAGSGVFFILVFVSICCCCCCCKKRHRMKKNSSSVVNYNAETNPAFIRNLNEYKTSGAAESGYKTPHLVGFNEPKGMLNDGEYLQGMTYGEYLKSNTVKFQSMDDDLYPSQLNSNKMTLKIDDGKSLGYLPMNQKK